MTKTKRPFQEVLADYKMLDESVTFLSKQIDSLTQKYDYLEESDVSEEVMLGVCGQIRHLYNKNRFESEKLELIGKELASFGVKID